MDPPGGSGATAQTAAGSAGLRPTTRELRETRSSFLGVVWPRRPQPSILCLFTAVDGIEEVWTVVSLIICPPSWSTLNRHSLTKLYGSFPEGVRG